MPSTAAAAIAVAFRAAPSDAVIDTAIHAAIAHINAGRSAAARQALVGLDEYPPASEIRRNLIGLIFLRTADCQSALAWFDRALATNPRFTDAMVNRGHAFQALGRLPEALAAFEAATKAGATDPAIAYNRGTILQTLGRLDEAIRCYDLALRLRPAYPEALRAGGLVLRDLGQTDAALEFFGEALRLKPTFVEALLDRCNLLHRLGRLDEAVAAYDAALVQMPGNADLLNNRGVALHELDRSQDALASLDAAVRARPESAQAHFNRGNVLLQAAAPAEALAAYDRALARRPLYADALCSRAVALKALGRMDEARDGFDAALAQDPGCAHAQNNRGALALLRGDFERGWPDYEYRWIAGQTPKQELRFPVPEWTGQSRPGERVVVFDEQGLGDTVQFARYLPLLAKTGADVTFFCRSRMLRLLRGLAGAVRLVDSLDESDQFDSQIALSSLPRVFGTRLDSIPAAKSYLTPDAALAAAWAQRIGTKGLKIGLCWSGSPNPKADRSRSIPLAAFAPLADLPDVRLISLQRISGLDEIAARPAGLRLEQLGDAFDAGPDAFVDAAAVIQNLDLVVTCDTSIAHLAGALGRPVWVLVKQVPDWRWQLDRTDSPWYPTMRLFRQTERGDWPGVVARVVAVLQAARSAASM